MDEKQKKLEEQDELMINDAYQHLLDTYSKS